MTSTIPRPVTEVSTSADQPTILTLPGVSFVSVVLDGTSGTLVVGPSSVPFRFVPSANGVATVEVDPGQVTLADLSAAVATTGGADPVMALPLSLAAAVGGVAISKFSAKMNLANRSLTDISVQVTAAGPWVVVPAKVEIADLELTVGFSDTAAGMTAIGSVAGTIALGSTVVPIRAERAAGAWTVTLASGDGVTLPGVADLAGLLGGDDLIDRLPGGLTELPNLVLSDVEITFAATGIVDSVAVSVATSAAIELPEPVNMSIDRLLVAVAVSNPGDPAARSVAVTVEGVASFAGAAVGVRIERADGQWTLTGGLKTGNVLSASAIARTYGATLPAQLPDLTLSEFQVRAVLDGSELSVTAGSNTSWTVPIGPDGIGVGGLRVQFQHQTDEPSFRGTIAGDVHLGGIVVPVSYSVPGGLKLTASLPSIAPFALLRDLCGATALGGLSLPPEVLAVDVTDVELTIDVERSDVSFAATGPGFKRVQAVVRKGTSWGFALGIELAATYKFSTLSAALGGLDKAKLPEALIVISSFDDTAFMFDELQPLAGTGISRGLLIDGRFDPSEIDAAWILGDTHLDVVAHVGTSLSDLELDAKIADIKIADGVVLRDAELQLVPDPENLSVSVLGAVDVTIDSSPLEFIGGVKVEPNRISFQSTMKGTWDSPFGAKGISVSDVALEIGTDLELVPSIGIAGSLKIGAFEGSAAVSFNSNVPTQSVLIVAFNHLSLMDVVHTFCPPSLASGVPADVSRTLAEISLDDVDLYVVPQDTAIGQLKYKQGIRAGGTLHAAGLTATAKVEIDPMDGISASGFVSPISIADVFSFTGADSVAGPQFALELKPTAIPKVLVSGKVHLLGASAMADIEFSDAGFHFDCAGRVFDAFEAEVSATGSSLMSADGFTVHAEMQQTFLSDLTRRVAAVLQDAGADAAHRIAGAEQAVTDAEADVKKLNAAAAAARADLAAKQADAQTRLQGAQNSVAQAQNSLSAVDGQITSTRASIQAQRDQATSGLRDAQIAVDSAQASVSGYDNQIAALARDIIRLNDEISALNRAYNRLGLIDKARTLLQHGKDVATRSAQITADGLQEDALQGKRLTAAGVLTVATKTLRAAQQAAVSYPIDQDPRILGLMGTRATAQLTLQGAQHFLATVQDATAAAISTAGQAVTLAAHAVDAATFVLQTANSTLDTVRKGVGEVAAVAGYIAEHGLEALLDVHSAAFTGSVSAVSGGSVTLDVDAVFQGREQVIHLSYDFGDLVAGAKTLAGALVPSLGR